MQMRRVLASVLVIAALVMSVTQIAFAVFSDSESIPGNTISTGVIDIGIGGPGSTQAEPIVAQGLMPGEWSDWVRYLVTNNSTNNVKLYFYVTDVSGDACVKTNLEIRTGVEGSDESERVHEVYNSGLMNIKGVINKVEVTGYVHDPVLMPEESAAVQMRAGLDLSANNNQSEETCTWTGVFFAEGSEDDGEEEPPTSFPVSFPEDHNEDEMDGIEVN